MKPIQIEKVIVPGSDRKPPEIDPKVAAEIVAASMEFDPDLCFIDLQAVEELCRQLIEDVENTRNEKPEWSPVMIPMIKNLQPSQVFPYPDRTEK